MNKLTQEQLDKMSVSEVLSITPDEIPEGMDVEHDNGSNPKLVPLDDGDGIVESSNESKEMVEDKVEDEKEGEFDKKAWLREKLAKENFSPDQNKGILFLRFFKKDYERNKIFTRLDSKIFFANDEIDDGWYVACVIEERPTFGIMDTIPLDHVKSSLWNSRYIRGIYTKRNYTTGMIEIYPAVSRSKLEVEQPPCIHKIPLHTSTIKDLIDQKTKESLSDMKNQE